MLSELIGNLRLALLVIVFIGFVALGVLLIAVEHRYYVLHIEGKFKYSKLVYWLAALVTVAALLSVYRIFFLEIYFPQPSLEATAYV